MGDWYDVVEVRARPNFRVWLRFEDGLEGEADLSDVAGCGVFRRWIDNPDEFSQVRRRRKWDDRLAGRARCRA